MQLFSSVHDVHDLPSMVKQALAHKKNPFAYQQLGKQKTLGLVFLNPSLRTRMSTQKAAMNLGMQVMVMNMDKDGWALEMNDGVVMNGSTVEHIREAAAVMGQYCDILGIRCFPSLKNKEEDYSEVLFHKFVEFCKVPVVSLESATRHPLQSFTDLITIVEHQKVPKPKVVLTWAPHIKPLPQAVPNSFAEWMCQAQAEGMLDFVITQPKGYELCSDYTKGALITHHPQEALENADFVYVKNWSSFHDYGSMPAVEGDWMLRNADLAHTNHAQVMHCLPVRRDLELSAEILDGAQSLVITEAGNRVWAAQTILHQMLENLK